MMKKRFFRRDCLFIFGWSLLDEQSLMILRPHLVTDIIAAGWPYAKVSNSSKKKKYPFLSKHSSISSEASTVA
jgi:hypothetical protein